MKSFLSSAKAKFIFIGGREMYDAFLADISDRDSFYSSIFNDAIYVDSFFKDKIMDSGGISQMTEIYVCQLIINKNFELKNNYNLSSYLNELVVFFGGEPEQSPSQLKNEENKLAIYKTIFLLQNFIIFLTYRSNGSPKKLADLFAGYVIRESQLADKEDALVIRSNGLNNESKEKNKKEKLFLNLSFKTQYEIGLTSSLYRPYVIIHSRHLKLLGDKLLYSTAFILDYILKFHQQAFSWKSLELIPDIILVNKDPNLRFFLEDLMRFLSHMHIRETLSGVFQYKFYSKVSSEIKLISKISEPSSAAFNFGLDESFQIKSYYKSKLNELQKSYKDYYPLNSDDAFVHSVTFIQAILGDLHYYDKEYDDAIMYYSDSIQSIRNKKDLRSVTNHQAVLFVQNMLKLGLCLEKIRSFDSAYSIYRSIILKIPYMVGPNRDEALLDNKWETPYIRMQLFVKPHIALLGLIEKQRMDGITYANLRRNREELDRFLGSHAITYLAEEGEINKRYEEDEQEETQAPNAEKEAKTKKAKDWRTLWALNFDYFNSVGGFLFYKNRNFPKLFESESQKTPPKGFNASIFSEFTVKDFNEFKDILMNPIEYFGENILIVIMLLP
ncbi:MAG: hypothetical protein IPK21_13860 [Haliscomenobacter sp.]|nr:hypothetical protein [Haliscomenobacter sp.]